MFKLRKVWEHKTWSPTIGYIGYIRIRKVWFSTNVSQNIDQVQNWENQVIWSNECITTGGKTLYFKEWIKRGIILVSDLYNREGEFMSMDEIKCKFENGGSACLKYLALYQAIPHTWKKISDCNCTRSGVWFKIW